LWFLTSLQAEVGVELEVKRRRELQFLEAAVGAVADILLLLMPRQIWRTQAIQSQLQQEEMAESLGAQQQRQEEQQPLRAQLKGLLRAHQGAAPAAQGQQQEDQQDHLERMVQTQAARLLFQPREAVGQEVSGDQRLEVAAEDVQQALLLREGLVDLMFHLDSLDHRVEHYQPRLMGGMAATEI
jgi:ligand-binding sensor domain-containing protein